MLKWGFFDMEAFGGVCDRPRQSRTASMDRDESLEDFLTDDFAEGWGDSLTAALLEAAVNGVSFATPGHRCGRSCGIVLSAVADSRV